LTQLIVTGKINTTSQQSVDLITSKGRIQMKSIRKRLTVKNDGFCNSNKPANERIDPVINRYAVKMQEKGWIPYCAVSAGNAFANYEAYVRLCKTNDPEEKKEMESRAIEQGWIKHEDGFLRV
jgi:hypothetical protein